MFYNSDSSRTAQRAVALLAGGLLAASTLMNTSAVRTIVVAERLGPWAASPATNMKDTISGSESATRPATPADQVRWLHETSGLTWEQLGKAFGVSRRAVHLWANDGRMNAGNAQILAELTAAVRALLAATPAERRIALLTPGADGASTLDRLRARNRGSQDDISAPALPATLLLGALDDHFERGPST